MITAEALARPHSALAHPPSEGSERGPGSGRPHRLDVAPRWRSSRRPLRLSAASALRPLGAALMARGVLQQLPGPRHVALLRADVADGETEDRAPAEDRVG